MLLSVIREKIDVTKLRWDVLQEFGHRTYYYTEDFDLWVMRVLAFSEGEAIIGTRLIYPGRSIQIKFESNAPKILIPVEQADLKNYWLPATIDEALWLADRLGLRIDIDSENLNAGFAVNCVRQR